MSKTNTTYYKLDNEEIAEITGLPNKSSVRLDVLVTMLKATGLADEYDIMLTTSGKMTRMAIDGSWVQTIATRVEPVDEDEGAPGWTEKRARTILRTAKWKFDAPSRTIWWPSMPKDKRLATDAVDAADYLEQIEGWDVIQGGAVR